eukprot:TRINITY_DN70789_c0_g1_i1.p1 TRINITY_DN70789_c0_g1~~TRINITY_DN70789_c0_g1_i1.p1  ORF type:complete len:158 (+),score=34.56 TRINITY_DN70789_c0_g1_i1:41-475(+)
MALDAEGLPAATVSQDTRGGGVAREGPGALEAAYAAALNSLMQGSERQGSRQRQSSPRFAEGASLKAACDAERRVLEGERLSLQRLRATLEAKERELDSRLGDVEAREAVVAMREESVARQSADAVQCRSCLSPVRDWPQSDFV